VPQTPQKEGRKPQRDEKEVADPRKRYASHWITPFPRFPKR